METGTAIPTKPLRAIDYLTCTRYLLKLGFKKREISKALKQTGLTVEKLTEVKGYDTIPQWKDAFEVVSDRHTYHTKEYKGTFHKDVTKVGFGVRESEQYQGLKHNKVIFQLLKNKFAWFDTFTKEVIEVEYPLRGCTNFDRLHSDFDNYTVAELKKLKNGKEVVNIKSLWEIYEMNSEDAEIYLNTGEGSLYVSIKALMQGDWSIIDERMKSYHGWYFGVTGYALNHKGRTKEKYEKDQKDAYNKSQKPLKSKIGEDLRYYLTPRPERLFLGYELKDYSRGIQDIKDTAREAYTKGKFEKISAVDFYYMPQDTLYLYERADMTTGLEILQERSQAVFTGQATKGFRPQRTLQGSYWVLIRKGKKQ